MIAKLNMMKFLAGQKISEFFKSEKGEVNIVAIVVLCGIAVLLAILFREQIADLMNDLFEEINNQATGAINETLAVPE